MTGRRVRVAAAAVAGIAWMAFVAPGAAHARILRSQASVERQSVLRGEPFMVTVTVESDGFNGPQIEAPNPPGILLERAGTSQNLVMAAGSMVRTDIVLYRATISVAGKHTIPAFTIRLSGERVDTSPIPVDVVTALPPAGGGGEGGGARGTALFARFLIDRHRVYWNEQIVGRAQIYSRSLLEDMPTWEAPDAPGFWGEPLGAPRHDRVTIDGEPYERYERLVAFFPTRSGRLTLGPARARVRVMRQADPSFDPFGGIFAAPQAEVVEVPIEAAPVDVTVDPLPPGAPPEFAGAVGSLSLGVRVDRSRVRAGEPVTITTSIQGSGNLASAADPRLLAVPAFPSYPAGSRTDIDRSGPVLRGVRRRDVTFVPDRPGSLLVLPISFSWFDPEEGRYRVQHSDTIAVRIDPAGNGAGGESDWGRFATAMPAPPRSSPGARGGLDGWPRGGNLLLGLASLVAYAGLGLGGMTRARAARDPARRRFALLEDMAREAAHVAHVAHGGDAARAAERMEAILREAASVRFDVDLEGRSQRDLLDRLVRAGAPEETIARTADLLSRLEAIAFGPAAVPGAKPAALHDAAAAIGRWRDECRP